MKKTVAGFLAFATIAVTLKMVRCHSSKSSALFRDSVRTELLHPPEMLDLLRQWWKARPSRYDGQMPVQER